MSSVSNLNDDELCTKLKEYGISSPVTASTRQVLLKKLTNAITAAKNNEGPQETSNSVLGNGLSSSSKKITKRKNSYALSRFSSDEDDEEEFSGPKTRLRSFRNGNDSPPVEYGRLLQPKRKVAKSYNDFEDLSTANGSFDSPIRTNDNSNLSNTSRSPLSRGRLSRKRRPDIDDASFSNQYASFSDSDVDEPKPKFVAKSKRDKPDNPFSYYKNFKLFDMKDDKRNLPVVSRCPKSFQRGTEIRILHNKNTLPNRDVSADEIVSQEMTSYQSSVPNGFPTANTTKDTSFEESTWSQSVSIMLLVLCVCFFLFVGLCYVNIQTSFVTPLSLVNSLVGMFTSGNLYSDGGKQIASKGQNLNIFNRDAVPICNGSSKKHCLSEKEYEALPKLLQTLEDVVVPELAAHASLYQCGRAANRYMKMNDIALLFEADLHMVSPTSVREGLTGFAKLVSTNADFGLETVWDNQTAEPLGLAVFPLPKEYLCYIFYGLYNIIYNLSAVIIALAVGGLIYQLVRYRKRLSQEKEQKLFELVEHILELLESSCVTKGKNFIAVNHIRDCLIPPRDRKAMTSLWNKAVKFIDEHDSRVYREIRLVGGDECEVWRWVSGAPRSPGTSSPSASAKNTSSDKCWQGKAFDSLESSQHFPSVPLSSCLKVRKMFDADLVFGKDWHQKVKDSLLQKCDLSNILHVAVDKESKEGCVYVKCASPHDAGLAFRALHGTWYDGNLVTVKYLRDEKYHERFPASRHVDTVLKHGSSSVETNRR